MKQTTRTRHWLTLPLTVALTLTALGVSGFAVSQSAEEPQAKSPEITSTNIPAPFGLGWGMTNRELVAEGFVPINPGAATGTRLFLSQSAPFEWPGAQAYMAITQDNRLAQVVAFSKPFIGDNQGEQGVAAYQRMKRLLIRQHGEPETSFEVSGLNPNAQTFYGCMADPGCGLYYSRFEAGNQTIRLNLTGEKAGRQGHQGSLIVSYEDVPNLGTLTLP